MVVPLGFQQKFKRNSKKRNQGGLPQEDFWIPGVGRSGDYRVERIGDSPFYGTPPAEINDCERWKSSPVCGGLPFSNQPINPNVKITVDPCRYGFEAEPVIGFMRLPKSAIYYIPPECRPKKPSVTLPDVGDKPSWAGTDYDPPYDYDDNKDLRFILVFEYHSFNYEERVYFDPETNANLGNAVTSEVTRDFALGQYIEKTDNLIEGRLSLLSTINYKRTGSDPESNSDFGETEFPFSHYPKDIYVPQSYYYDAEHYNHQQNCYWGKQKWGVIKNLPPFWKNGSYCQIKNDIKSSIGDFVIGEYVRVNATLTYYKLLFVDNELPLQSIPVEYPRDEPEHMSCCNEVQDLKRQLRQIAKVLAVDQFDNLHGNPLIHSKRKQKFKLRNYLDVMRHQLRQNMEIQGLWELKLNVNGEEVVFNNLSEAIKEMLAMQIATETGVKANTKGMMLMHASLASMRQALYRVWGIVRSTADYLDFPTQEEIVDLELPVTLEDDNLKPKDFLQPSTREVALDRFTEKVSFSNILSVVLKMAEGWIAQNGVRFGANQDPGDVARTRMEELNDKIRATTDETEENFKKFTVDLETQFKGVAGMDVEDTVIKDLKLSRRQKNTLD